MYNPPPGSQFGHPARPSGPYGGHVAPGHPDQGHMRPPGPSSFAGNASGGTANFSRNPPTGPGQPGGGLNTMQKNLLPPLMATSSAHASGLPLGQNLGGFSGAGPPAGGLARGYPTQSGGQYGFPAPGFGTSSVGGQGGVSGPPGGFVSAAGPGGAFRSSGPVQPPSGTFQPAQPGGPFRPSGPGQPGGSFQPSGPVPPGVFQPGQPGGAFPPSGPNNPSPGGPSSYGGVTSPSQFPTGAGFGMPGSPTGTMGPGTSGMPGGHPSQQQRTTQEHIPNPIALQASDEELHKDETVNTSQRSTLPPLVNTSCTYTDTGNCSPRFMRSTLYNVPCSQELLHDASIPFGVVVQPMARLPPRENTIYVVEQPTGPVRCRRCKAYINCHVQFVDGGRCFVCNICSVTNEVPSEYFCNLDHTGRRVDLAERPELLYGSVEFAATAEYCKGERLPDPPSFIFLLDVTYPSIQSGLVGLLSRMLPHILDSLPKEGNDEKSKVRIGFATYNRTVHFYNLKSSLVQPQMMIISDIQDMFVPLVDGFLVDADEGKPLIENLLQQIPEMFANTQETESCFGPAIQAGMEALKASQCCGKIFVFHSTLPNMEAPGQLKNREDRKLYNTEKEPSLYGAQTPFYSKLGNDCVENGVSVELFLCTNGYVDVVSMAALVGATGGEIHRYPYFKAQTDGERLVQDLVRSVQRQAAFDAILRIRCCTGIRATGFWGNFFMSNTTDVQLATIDCDKAIAVEIKYDDKLAGENSTAYVQAALLYTSVGGKRRLRIHNLALNCTQRLEEVFRCAEMDTIMNMFCKKAVKRLLESPLKAVQGALLEQIVNLLACYRKKCSLRSPPSELVLPDSLKLLPLYVCSLLKCGAVRAQMDTSVDDKAWQMHLVQSMPLTVSTAYLYPRVLPLHDLSTDKTELPNRMRCYYTALSGDGAYLLENGISMIVWVGRNVSPRWLSDVFGISGLTDVDITTVTQLPVLDNPVSARVRGVISLVRAERSHYLKMYIALQGHNSEPMFRRLLCEDSQSDGSASYMDLLHHVHREVTKALK